LALQGNLAPKWRLSLRADDISSYLKWSNLATDTNTLNSQVTSRAPDGSLDYAPLLQGKKALLPIATQIGVHWQAQVGWALWQSQAQPDELTIQWSRQGNVNQTWFGWSNGPAANSSPHWFAAIEPIFGAAKLGWAWGGWQAVMATDGRGLDSQYRALELHWRHEF
jgi:hypothetical protein